MEESVAGFNGIFSQQVVRGMAVIAGGRRMMAGFDPAAVLITHGMTVGACAGTVLQIRVALGVNKGIAAQPDCQAHQDRDGQVQN